MPEGVGYKKADRRAKDDTKRIAKRKKGNTSRRLLGGQAGKTADAVRRRQEMLKNI